MQLKRDSTCTGDMYAQSNTQKHCFVNPCTTLIIVFTLSYNLLIKNIVYLLSALLLLIK